MVWSTAQVSTKVRLITDLSEVAQVGPATGQGSRQAPPLSEVAQVGPATGQGSRPGPPTEAGQLQEDRAAAQG